MNFNVLRRRGLSVQKGLLKRQIVHSGIMGKARDYFPLCLFSHIYIPAILDMG